MAHPFMTAIVGMVGSIASLVGLSYTPPDYVREGEIVKAVNSQSRKLIFGSFVVFEGMRSIYPIFLVS